jgi:cell wall-associated NlpC family hydrolase
MRANTVFSETLRQSVGAALIGVAMVALMSTASAAPSPGPADALGPLLPELGTPALPAPGAADPSTAVPSLAERMHRKASDMVITAMNFLGVPYKRGGSSANAGFDCSGFTRHVFETSLGLVLPRRVDQQAHAPGLVAVKKDDLQPGDLVFFNTLKRTFSHVGIYIGEGRFIHSPRPGAEVRIEQMSVAYWRKRFSGARRAEAAEAAAAKAAMDATEPATAAQNIPR